MNFLGLGPGELILIAALGLVIFGPGKLPEIAAQVGRAVRDFRRSTTEITSEFQNSFRLDDPPPPPAPAGPAAPFAGSSSTDTEPPQQSEAVSRASEPPLADTFEWHWESSESTASAGGSAGSADGASQPGQAGLPVGSGQPVDSSGSLWEWDASATAPLEEGPRATTGEPASGGSMWQWDKEASHPGQGDAPTAIVSASAQPEVERPDAPHLPKAPRGKKTTPRRKRRPSAQGPESE